MYIGPDGPKTARMVICGEKPGREELRVGRPFVGESGRQLDQLLAKIGISRNQVYITNAVKKVEKLGNPTTTEIEAEQLSLFKELLALPNANVIVPMGNVALQSLSNFHLGISGQGKEAEKKGTGIAKYRGSILPSFIGKKMVPTFHPAYYMRGEWRWKSVVQFDLARALEESYNDQITVPNRKCYIAQTRDDIEFIRRKFTSAAYISFDIELHRGRFIQCIAFSLDPSEGYCIPFTNLKRQSQFSIQDEIFAWKVVQEILNQKDSCYVTQNGLFDCWHLWRHGVVTPYMHLGFDTMLAHRLRAPDLPHDLGFLVSIYTREPYYKDESGDWKDQNRNVTDRDFYAYNCKDAACTLEVAHKQILELKKFGMYENFKEEIQRQWQCVAEMRQIGMRIDVPALQQARQIIKTDISTDEQKIKSIVGWIPNTRSHLQMEKLYDQLQIKATRSAKSNRVKTDVDQLYQLAYNNPQHRDLLYVIASLNNKRTLQSGFTGMAIDHHSFYHPSLDISKTKTGRMASKGADEGGPQIQNIPKRLRAVFVPDDEESELTNADLAGAETWIQAFVSEEPLLMAALIQGIKVHNVRGCLIYRGWTKSELPPKELLLSIKKVCDDCAKLGEKECNHSEYYMAKQSGHALAYREGPRRFCTEQRKKGIFITEAFAKEVRQKVITPPIANWHMAVENELRRTSWLTTPLGRRRQFFGFCDDKLVNQALSWYCQATVGQITNRAMIKLHEEFKRLNLAARIWTNTHDSVTTTHHKSIRDIIKDLYQSAFACPITIHGRSFTIPIEITHGPNWRDLK